jgi:hypothetical protein
MGSNRRKFLQFAGLAPAAAASAALAATGTTPAADARPPTLTRSTFLPCVGDEFQFESGPFEAKKATLVRVADFEQRRKETDPEGRFRLLFEPATAGTLAQETYTVTHATLGRFALFVSPNDAEGRVVEAVFNRL